MTRSSEIPPPGDLVVDSALGQTEVMAGSASKKPWHKPVFYVLSELSNVSGAPTDKMFTAPAFAEDETNPDPTARQKQYRPLTP